MTLRAFAASLALLILTPSGLIPSGATAGLCPQEKPSDARSAREQASAALAAVPQADWESAISHGTQAMRLARAAIANAPDRCEQLRLAEFLALGAWCAARGEHELSRSTAALELLDVVASEPALASEHRGLLLALYGALCVDSGVPDRATESLARAMKMTAAPEPETCVRGERQKCPRHSAVPRPREHASYLDAHRGEVARLLALGVYKRAEQLCDEIERAVDWDAAAGQLGEGPAGARRAQLAVYRATARVGRADGDRALLESARAEFERTFEFAAFDPQDGITAACGVLEIDLELREFPRAKAYLADVDGWLALDESHHGSIDDRAWLAALRARLHRLSGGDPAQSISALRAGLDAWLTTWRRIERSGGVGVLAFDRPRLLLVELFRAGGADAAIEHALRAQQFGVLWRALGEPAPTVEQMRGALCDADTGCLVYVISAGESVVLAFDGRSAELHALAPASRIDANTNALNEALQAGDEPSVQQREVLSRKPNELADQLFPAALRARLRAWKHVRIVGFDQIGVPLQSLSVLDGRPLGVTHSIAYLPSLASAWRLHERRAGLKRRPAIALVAAPQVSKDAMQRFGSARAPIEKSQLEPLLGSAGVRALDPWVGKRATLGALREARASADVAHVVAHGGIDAALELRTLVLLTPDAEAPDGLLTVERARTLDAPDVVLLSVCRSADGISRAGDGGATDLGGALLMAGASSVALSNLELRLSDAVQFGAVVHARLSAGDTLMRAVQAANAEFCAKQPGRATWTLPFVVGLGL